MRARTLLTILLVMSLLLVLTFALGDLWQRQQQAGCDPQGSALSVDPGSIPPGTVAGMSRDQLAIAATIMVAAQQRGMSARDQQIGVMVGLGESTLTNVNHGDAAGPDSRGVFQQRANGAWGSLAQRMDPAAAAGMFFDALGKVQDRDSLAPTIAAHRVQGNADPNYYAQFWDTAGAIVTFLAGVRPATGAPAPGQTATPAGTPQTQGNVYGLKNVLPGTITIANTLGPKFGIKDVGGWRPTDPWPDHPGGYALDFMVPVGSAQGDQLAQYIVANAKTLHVDYMLYRQRSWNPRRGTWQQMEDRHSITANHFDHVHLSIDKAWASGSGGSLGPLSATNCTLSTNHAAAVSRTGWASPVAGSISSHFGPRSSPGGVGSTWHKGTDVAAACGEPIYAAQSGTVEFAGPAQGYGNLVRLDHGGGVTTQYGHMPARSIQVHAGDKVTAGQQIAQVGTEGASTGCHLHFEVRVNGSAVDPEAFYAQNKTGVVLGAQ